MQVPELFATIASKFHLAAYALGHLSQAEANKGIVGGKILTSSFTVESDTAPDTGIDISKVTLNITPDKIEGASYSIRNLSSKALIAYTLSIDLYWDAFSEKPISMTVSKDAWFLNGVLLNPGEEAQHEIMTVMGPSKAMRLVRAVATLQYAGFSDGSVVGTNPAPIKTKLASARRIKLDLQHEYASYLRSGKSATAVVEKLESDLASGPRDRVRMTTLSQLYSLSKNSGDQGLADKLLEEPKILINK